MFSRQLSRVSTLSRSIAANPSLSSAMRSSSSSSSSFSSLSSLSSGSRLFSTITRSSLSSNNAIRRLPSFRSSLSSSLSSSSPSSPLHLTPKRFLNIHEYQSLELFSKYGIPTYRFKTAATATEAEEAANELGGNDYVVKAQVLSGGRGKGKFIGGLHGGVHTAVSAAEVYALASKMLGDRLVTKQSGPEGKLCHHVLVGERVYLRRETYFSILLDRATSGPVFVASAAGGMDIEKVAADNPKLILKEPIDPNVGVTNEILERITKGMGFSTAQARAAAGETIKKLYKLFMETDASLVEINPMGETHDHRVLCVDAKLNFDDNAQYRQPDIFNLRDHTQEDSREVEAEKYGLNYIGLDGDIGCIVNGAGLAMATMDAIKLYGGEPANFLDLGGGATKDQVTEAFQLLHSDPAVRSVLVNIFGGIARCDVIALGLIAAANKIGLKKPVVIRLAGTNVQDAKKVIEDSGLRMLTADDLGEAAQKVVRVTQILKMAEDAQVTVSFELPI